MAKEIEASLNCNDNYTEVEIRLSASDGPMSSQDILDAVADMLLALGGAEFDPNTKGEVH